MALSSLSADKDTVAPVATGASLTAVMLVAKATALLERAVLPPLLLASRLPAALRLELLSTKRAVNSPGVPLKSAAGLKRSLALAGRNQAELSLKLVARSDQVLPLLLLKMRDSVRGV